MNSATLVIVISLIYFADGLIWNFGDCVVYYDEPCTKDVVQFKLYTHKMDSSRKSTILDPFRPSMPRSLLGNATNLKLKILIHGYGGLGVDYAIKNVTAAYKEVATPVIIVDWSTIATTPCYPTAFFNTWHVGQCTAILSVSLAKLGIPPSNIHIIGFSLGAHIASFASNQLQKTLGIPYSRITGLDPALPFFATLKNEWKLDPSDAPFVDIIHTSAGSFGKLEAIGHVDFYVNGGAMQPNCIHANYPQLCSHIMAGSYFANTIRKKKYLGYACPSILHYSLGFCPFEYGKGVLMGEHVNTKLRGIFFVETQQQLFQKLFWQRRRRQIDQHNQTQ